MSTPYDRLIITHHETCKTCLDILQKKNADYCGGSGDPYANFRISSSFGVHPAMGIVLRITDKLQRIRAFATNGTLAVKEESVFDACNDIVNYAILLKGMLGEEISHQTTNQKPETQCIKQTPATP